MRKSSKKRTRPTRKLGLPPGSLVHIGEIKTDKPSITLIEFDARGVTETCFESLEASRGHHATREKMWLNVYGLHDPTVMAEIGRRFKLHPLVQEDILNTQQRPKSDEYTDYQYIVGRCFDFDTETRSLTSDQVSIVLGRNFVLTFQERPAGRFQPFRERLKNAVGPARRLGASYLAYSLLDVIVDHYFVTLDQLGDTVDELDSRLLAGQAWRPKGGVALPLVAVAGRAGFGQVFRTQVESGGQQEQAPIIGRFHGVVLEVMVANIGAASA